MGLISLLFNPETKSIFITLPRPVFHAIETYAYMEKIETEEALEQAIIFFLSKKLHTIKDKSQPDFKMITPHHAIRQDR